MLKICNIQTVGKMYTAGGGLQLKINCSSIVHAAKRNDYERVKVNYWIVVPKFVLYQYHSKLWV